MRILNVGVPVVRMIRTGLVPVAVALLAIGAPIPVCAQSEGWSVGLVRSVTFAAGGPLSVVETARYESIEIDLTRPILVGETWRLEFPIGLIDSVVVVPAASAARPATTPDSVRPDDYRRYASSTHVIGSVLGRIRAVGADDLLRDAEGPGPVRVRLAPLGRTAEVGPDGRFDFGEVPPGSYTVQVDLPGVGAWSMPTHVRAHSVAEMSIEVNR